MLSSCSSANKEEASVNINENVVADASTKLAVEGMVCSMGCVAAIEDKLNSTLGVSGAKVSYEGGFAEIDYDSKLVSEDELIAAIGSIGDHAYSAKPFTTETQETDELVEVAEAVETIVK